MKPAPFELHRVTSISHAVELLVALGHDGETGEDVDVKIIAGGQSLIPLLNFRLARPAHLIDVSGVDELVGVRIAGGRMRIGSMTRQRDLITAAVEHELPLLHEAVLHIGHSHIRNRGTIGGSLAHADPASELPAVMIALRAELVVAGPAGSRVVAAEDFFAGWFTTTLAVDEILTAVEIPLDGVGAWGFEELARRHGDFATVLAAVMVDRNADGVVTDSRIVLGGVGPSAVRSKSAEAALQGTVGVAGIELAAAAAPNDCSPTNDVHASAEYRSTVATVLVERALLSALERPELQGPAEAQPQAVIGSARIGEAISEVAVVVNGMAQTLAATPDRRLLADWLRDDLDLTGTHLGCEHGVCGACTVLLDGDPVRSCLMFARQAEGHEVTTIEALGSPTDLHPLQEAFRAHHGLQCGFCTPGMVLTSLDLLNRIPNPTEAQIRQELSGNICRCTGYVKIVESVQAAARTIGDRRA